MKRGKDDDKIMGPMFPRLHVNDTEKGGPRAPPRNKMALYEQLTVPSQRYNIGAVPPSQNNNLVSSTSTNQVTGRERNMYFPLYRQHSTSSYDELQVRQPEAVNLGGEMAQVENRKKPVEEDDFMVPIFSQPGTGQCNGNTQNSMDGERASHLSLNHTMPLGGNGQKPTNSIINGDLVSRQNVINEDCRNLRASNVSARSSDFSAREKDGGSQSENAFVQRGCREKRVNSLEKTDACLSQDDEDTLQAVEPRYGEFASERPLQSNQKDISLRLKHNPRAGCEYKDLDEPDNGMARTEDERSLERENIDRGNDVSETSMVDSISGGDLCPDDVVGIIGRKHFWKARTAIVNQQRVFAVQVFELHRLIKVQKHIAGSPHLLLEGSAFVGKTSLKDSALKKYSSEYGVEALAHSVKKKDASQKPADKLEGTAENAVAKAPNHLHNAIQPAGYRPPSVSPALPPPANTDPKMNPWGFQQPPIQQWLVPVMSPSEGLVYKPYPAPGMMGPMCGGGCGPGGPSPMVGNMMNPTYGMPNPHYHQGMGMPQPIPYGGQGYFPGYAMPLMSPVMSGSAVDQMNQFSGPSPYGQTDQPATRSVNQSLQNQNSCNMSGQKNGTTARALPSRDVERQGSTASSPSERAQGTAMPVQTEGRDALPLFPVAPTTEISEGGPPTENASRVIKVVPHNPKSTRESAARIFQSIQAERQQFETN